MKQSGGREEKIISEHMAALARRSHRRQREQAGGDAAYCEQMRRRGRLGGRPKRSQSDEGGRL